MVTYFAVLAVLAVLSIATIDMNERLKSRNMDAFQKECEKLKKLLEQ